MFLFFKALREKQYDMAKQFLEPLESLKDHLLGQQLTYLSTNLLNSCLDMAHEDNISTAILDWIATLLQVNDLHPIKDLTEFRRVKVNGFRLLVQMLCKFDRPSQAKVACDEMLNISFLSLFFFQ
jgi:hypothetical protein